MKTAIVALLLATAIASPAGADFMNSSVKAYTDFLAAVAACSISQPTSTCERRLRAEIDDCVLSMGEAATAVRSMLGWQKMTKEQLEQNHKELCAADRRRIEEYKQSDEFKRRVMK